MAGVGTVENFGDMDVELIDSGLQADTLKTTEESLTRFAVFDDTSNELSYVEENDLIGSNIIEEEKRLEEENKQIEKQATALARKEQQLLERRLAKETLAKEEEAKAKQRDAEIKERRYKRLMHLLKNSRMYSSMLRDKICGEGDPTSKKKKTKPKLQAIRESNQGWKKRKLEASYDLNEVLDKKDLLEDGSDVDAESEEQATKVIDFFEDTRVTDLGFTVSQYQPMLFEGGRMKDYQLQGLEWLKVLFTNGVNGILGDEMGLGKTIQVIAFICYLIEQDIEGPFLIVAPLSTISNWINEFKRFAPKVPTFLFHGYKDERKALIPKLKQKVEVMGKKIYQVIITSYQVPLSEKRVLSQVNWHYVIVDEGHRIKNHNTQLSRTLRDFDTIGRLLLTGTPLQNNLYELWSLLNFILPEVFNAIDVFESWFDVEELESGGARFMEEKLNVNVVSTLQQILIPFLLRREKKDVKLDLPPKKEVLVYCPMTLLQRNLYQATVDRTIDILLRPKQVQECSVDINQPTPKRTCALKKKALYVFDDDPDNDPMILDEVEVYEKNLKEYALDIVMQNPQMQLRKIVNHPYLVQFPLIAGTKQLRIDEDLVNKSGKLLVLDAMLAKLKAHGHKVIIFSTFTILLDILEEHAIMREYNYRRLDGSINLEAREADIKSFNEDPDVFIYFISIRAGGLGINLTSADTAIIYDSDWNPQVNLQAQDRCHRIGQTKPVVVYKFCTSGTIDERIIERGNAKRRLEKIIIQKGKFTAGVQNSTSPKRLDIMDLQDLKKLLESTDHSAVIHPNGFVFTDEELDALLDRSDLLNEASDDGEENKENRQVFKVDGQNEK